MFTIPILPDKSASRSRNQDLDWELCFLGEWDSTAVSPFSRQYMFKILETTVMWPSSRTGTSLRRSSTGMRIGQKSSSSKILRAWNFACHQPTSAPQIWLKSLVSSCASSVVLVFVCFWHSCFRRAAPSRYNWCLPSSDSFHDSRLLPSSLSIHQSR